MNTACDLCGTTSDVQHYDVKTLGLRHPMDLCQVCGKPLADLIRDVDEARAARPKAKRRPRSGRFATLEEIEARKRRE